MSKYDTHLATYKEDDIFAFPSLIFQVFYVMPNMHVAVSPEIILIFFANNCSRASGRLESRIV
jgi:hypothetical protein